LSKVIQIAANAVNAKLYNASREISREVSNLLSYRVSGAEHSAAFKAQRWDGRSTFYDFKTGLFPAGFVHLVLQHLRQKGHTVQLVRKPFPAPQGPKNPKVDNFPENPDYAYQLETVNKLVKHGQMVAQVATGGGKSRICRLAVARIARMSLFITTRGVLMHQMKDAFEETTGRKVGVLGDGEWTPRRSVNVGMVQTLMSRLKIDEDATGAKLQRQIEVRNKTIKFLSMVEFVILEEAHEAGGNSYYEILRHCKNAHYRLSLTATPFMKDDEEANMRLMACSGPVGIRISEKFLIDRGILARPYFKYVELGPPAMLHRLLPWKDAYKVGIVENEMRNRHIVWEAERAAQNNMPVMILVQQKKHGETLKKLLKERRISSEFIYGKHEQEERKEALQRLGSGKISVLIGSTILDVGVDVPAVGLVILAGGGKAEVALRQRIGRGLRRKKSGPNIALIVDFVDPGNTHLRKHARERRRIVESTDGFNEGILGKNEDFNFTELGLAA